MSRRKKEKDPFFMIFPWGKVAGLLFLLLLGSMFVYRISETGGLHVSRACLLALIITVTGGLVGIYVISEMWGKDVYWMLIGVTLAAVIRLLISGAGTAIITFFVDIHRSWFILFLGIYYLAFLAMDTWLALWILRNSEIKGQERDVNDTIWNMFS